MFGQHLILDLKNCDKSVVCNKLALYGFSKKLVDLIEMKAYGEPIIKHFAKENPGAAGYTLVQLIETSSIVGHFVDKSGDGYLDIFSCKEFDTESVNNFIQFELAPESIHYKEISRG